jgi:hypothetical protein
VTLGLNASVRTTTGATRHTTTTVLSTDNPWLAGQTAIPDGVVTDGTIPTSIPVLGGQTVTFSATGSVGCSPGFPGTPDGENGCPGLQKEIASDLLGLSGIYSGNRSQFLAGVFTDDNTRPTPPPPALDFTAGANPGTDFTALSTQLNQVFYIGDGVTGSGVTQVFHVPAGANHLTLGVTDAIQNQGPPGAYSDNVGSFTVDTTIGDPPITVKYSIVDPPTHGSAHVDGDQLTYTPAPGFTGDDALTYRVSADNGSAVLVSSPAMVHIRVNPSAGPPVIAPIAAITTDGTVTYRDVIASAPGATDLALAATGLPPFADFTDLGSGRGIITVDGAHAVPGSFTAAITATDEVGSSSAPVAITVHGNRSPVASDATATTTSGTPVAVTVRAADPDNDAITYSLRSPAAHGTVTGSGSVFTYTPEAGFAGTDAFTFSASDGQLTATGAVTLTVAGPQPAPAPKVDGVVSRDVTGSPAKLTSPVLTTRAQADLLLAFVTVDGPADTRQTINSVTGGGLTWTLASAKASRWGCAEVWQARASGTFSAAVTAVPARAGYRGSITVTGFSGAASTVGASSAATGVGPHPEVPLTSTSQNSLVWATGHDWDTSKARTTVAGQELVHQFVATGIHDTFWVQRFTNPVGPSTPVKVETSASAKDRWQLAAVEIRAA